MKRKKLSVLAVCLALLLGLLAGCGGGDDAEITAEDFYGCWEYEAYDLWLVVHEDEAYDWISPTDTSSGTYTGGWGTGAGQQHALHPGREGRPGGQ